MRPIFKFKAWAYFRTKARCHQSEIYDNIPAVNSSAAMREFTAAWSAPNVSLTNIKCEKGGEAYDVGSQPERYKAFGYPFRDNDIIEVRFYPDSRTIHFKTRSMNNDLSAGLNWTESEFKEITDRIKDELELK